MQIRVNSGQCCAIQSRSHIQKRSHINFTLKHPFYYSFHFEIYVTGAARNSKTTKIFGKYSTSHQTNSLYFSSSLFFRLRLLHFVLGCFQCRRLSAFLSCHAIRFCVINLLIHKQKQEKKKRDDVCASIDLLLFNVIPFHANV